MKQIIVLLVWPLLFITYLPADAASEPVSELLTEYRVRGATEFSALRGQDLWQTDFNGRGCTSCHTDDPAAQGRHLKTRKLIAPLAPSVSPKRLTELRTIRKWLRRNCKWTLGRECTPQEKGDLLTWLSRQ